MGYSAVVRTARIFPTTVPVADAVDQQRATASPMPDEEAPEEPVDNVPLEVAPSDGRGSGKPSTLTPSSGIRPRQLAPV